MKLTSGICAEAREMRDTARQELFDVLPDLSPDAVVFSNCPDDLAVTAFIKPDLAPDTQGLVREWLGALDVRVTTQVEAV